MALAEMNWQPTARQLRQFGLISLVLLPILGWWVTTKTKVFGIFRGQPIVWDAGHQTTVMILLGLGILAGGLAIVHPKLLKWPFVGLSLLTMPIGMIVGEIVLMLMYFGVFTPMALVFRLIGRDALQLRRPTNAASYWRAKPRPASVASYYRQS